MSHGDDNPDDDSDDSSDIAALFRKAERVQRQGGVDAHPPPGGLGATATATGTNEDAAVAYDEDEDDDYDYDYDDYEDYDEQKLPEVSRRRQPHTRRRPPLTKKARHRLALLPKDDEDSDSDGDSDNCDTNGIAPNLPKTQTPIPSVDLTKATGALPQPPAKRMVRPPVLLDDSSDEDEGAVRTTSPNAASTNASNTTTTPAMMCRRLSSSTGKSVSASASAPPSMEQLKRYGANAAQLDAVRQARRAAVVLERATHQTDYHNNEDDEDHLLLPNQQQYQQQQFQEQYQQQQQQQQHNHFLHTPPLPPNNSTYPSAKIGPEEAAIRAKYHGSQNVGPEEAAMRAKYGRNSAAMAADTAMANGGSYTNNLMMMMNDHSDPIRKTIHLTLHCTMEHAMSSSGTGTDRTKQERRTLQIPVQVGGPKATQTTVDQLYAACRQQLGVTPQTATIAMYVSRTDKFLAASSSNDAMGRTGKSSSKCLGEYDGLAVDGAVISVTVINTSLMDWGGGGGGGGAASSSLLRPTTSSSSSSSSKMNSNINTNKNHNTKSKENLGKPLTIMFRSTFQVKQPPTKKSGRRGGGETTSKTTTNKPDDRRDKLQVGERETFGAIQERLKHILVAHTNNNNNNTANTIQIQNVVLLFDGQKLLPQGTPASEDMEEDDLVDVQVMCCCT